MALPLKVSSLFHGDLCLLLDTAFMVPYLALSVVLQCNHKHQCFTCEPNGDCTPLKHHQRLMVSQHGALQGRHQMKAEIFARGPITCGIMATAGLDAYTGTWQWQLACLLAETFWVYFQAKSRQQVASRAGATIATACLSILQYSTVWFVNSVQQSSTLCGWCLGVS